ncbi:MAG: pirin family protein [Verrucomicrobiota bacterium]
MIINVLRSEERGKSNTGWLHSCHSFSFGEYDNPQQMGFRSLRVINEDLVAPGMGFPTHPHRSMEILSYIVEGALAHKDDMGNESRLGAGQFQYMSAGDGVRHSEYNPSDSHPVHFLQIWIEPREKGGEPRYKDLDLASAESSSLKLLASPDGENGSAEIRQNAQVFYGRSLANEPITIPKDGRYPYAWIQLITGELKLGAVTLFTGDGAAMEGETFEVVASKETSFLFFKLA